MTVPQADWPPECGSMQALVLTAPHVIEFRQCDIPKLESETDAIVRVELAGLCGSDLHPYRGKEATDAGTIMGHEFVGTVVQVGPAVTSLAVGTRVLSPFTTSCGKCWACESGLTCRCTSGQLFGCRVHGTGLHGAQAQFVRVPLAESTLLPIPEGVTDERALLAGDILSTGYFCARNANLDQKGTDVTVAVVGCGPVGLLAGLAAGRHASVKVVLALDSVQGRLDVATSLGMQAIDITNGDAVEVVRAATGGRGADAVLEVVGAGPALGLAMEILRPGGIISSVGCHTDPGFPFPPGAMYDKNATLVSGRCPARACAEELVPLLARGDLADCSRIITHRLPLSAGPEAYKSFEARTEGWVKVVLDPWA